MFFNSNSLCKNNDYEPFYEDTSNPNYPCSRPPTSTETGGPNDLKKVYCPKDDESGCTTYFERNSVTNMWSCHRDNIELPTPSALRQNPCNSVPLGVVGTHTPTAKGTHHQITEYLCRPDDKTKCKKFTWQFIPYYNPSWQAADGIYGWDCADPQAPHPTRKPDPPQTPPPDPPKKKTECFAGSELVLLANGKYKPIKDIKIGDYILTANKYYKLSFSPVIFLPHEKNNIKTSFKKITSNKNKTLKLTQEHNIIVNNKVIFASEIIIGDEIISVDGPETITNIEIVEDYGVYTAFTNNEFIVVNDIIASPLAYVSHYDGTTFIKLLTKIHSINSDIGNNIFNFAQDTFTKILCK